MCRKLGRGAPPPFWEGERSPRVTHCRLGWGLPPYQVASLCIQPFSHNRNGQKIGERAPPLLGRGAGSPSNRRLPVPRPTSTRSGILIHAGIWPQQIWAENWGLCCFGRGSWVPIWSNVARAESYLNAKFHLDPSNRLATVHQRHRQDRQTEMTDRQDNGPIGRTVLQTVAQ